jgi:hypothetical protein
MALTVYSDYDKAVAVQPRYEPSGFKLYCVGCDLWLRWVWARAKKDAIVAVAVDRGYTAHINRPGVTLEGTNNGNT